jgi:adenosylcobinamide-GDP ribazoletransferase
MLIASGPMRLLRRLRKRLGNEIRFALTAWVYFTRVPLPAGLSRWVGYEADYLSGSARYFPVVGVAVGALGAAVYLLALRRFPPSVAVLLSMAATLLVTGAFHEDGLADCFDAFGGAYTREDTLRIMHDSRIGAFGAIALVLALLLKWQVLTALPSARVAWLMVGAHAASRSTAISLMLSLDYVRDQGRAKPLAQRLGLGAAAVAGLTGLVCLIWPDWRWACGALLLLLLLRAFLAHWFKRRLGGYTGDCLGLTQQLSELALYLLALAWT